MSTYKGVAKFTLSDQFKDGTNTIDSLKKVLERYLKKPTTTGVGDNIQVVYTENRYSSEVTTHLSKAMFSYKTGQYPRVDEALLKLAGKLIPANTSFDETTNQDNTYYQFALLYADALGGTSSTVNFKQALYGATKQYLFNYINSTSGDFNLIREGFTPSEGLTVWNNVVEPKIRNKQITKQLIDTIDFSNETKGPVVAAFLSKVMTVRSDGESYNPFQLYNIVLDIDNNIRKNALCNTVYCNQFIEMCLIALEFYILMRLVGKLIYSRQEGGCLVLNSTDPLYTSNDSSYDQKISRLTDRITRKKTAIQTEKERMKQAYGLLNDAITEERKVGVNSNTIEKTQETLDRSTSKLAVLLSTESLKRTDYHRAMYGTILIAIIAILMFILFAVLLDSDPAKLQEKFNWLTKERFFNGIILANGLTAVGIMVYEITKLFSD